MTCPVCDAIKKDLSPIGFMSLGAMLGASFVDVNGLDGFSEIVMMVCEAHRVPFLDALDTARVMADE